MGHHYDELYPSRFTKATQLAQPMTVRIAGLSREDLEGDDGVKAKGVLRYRTAGPDGKPIDGEMVLARTNAALIAAIVGSDDHTTWPGHLITIANDPTVMFGKDKVGGIRVCGSPELKSTKRVEVKRPRRKRPDVYVLQPTDGKGRVTTGGTISDHGQRSPSPPAAEAPPADNREPGADDQ